MQPRRTSLPDLNWERGYSKWSAYGRSKLANLLFTYELARRLGAAGSPVKAVACHPGYSNTNLQSVGPQMHGSKLAGGIWAVLDNLVATPAFRGAQPTVYAAASEAVQSGDFIGPTGLCQRGDPGQATSNSSSHVVADQRQLWEASERFTGVGFPV